MSEASARGSGLKWNIVVRYNQRRLKVTI